MKKFQIEKSEEKYTKSNEEFNRQNGNLRNSCKVKVRDVGVEGMMALPNVGALV